MNIEELINKGEELVRNSELMSVGNAKNKDLVIRLVKDDYTIGVTFEDTMEVALSPLKKQNQIIDVETFTSSNIPDILLFNYSFLKEYVDKKDVTVSEIRPAGNGIHGVIVCKHPNFEFFKAKFR